MPMKENSKKRHARIVVPVVCVGLAALIAGGSFVGYGLWQKQQETVFVSALSEQLDKNAQQLETTDDTRAELLSNTYSRLKSEREAKEAEAARIAAEKRKAEEEAKRKAEAARIEAEKKKAEAARIAAEKKRKEDEARKKAAEQAAKSQEVINAEKQNATAEKNERARLSAKIKAQEANATAENEEYINRGVTPIVNLGVQAIMQNPELPNGCEVTSLAIVINSMDSYVDKCTLSDVYLPQFPFYRYGANKVRAGGDPNLYYAGNPRLTSNAYYCFAGPLVSAANNYFDAVGMNMTAVDLTGADEAELVRQLDMGFPVVVWGTLSMGDAFTYVPNAWVINEQTGEKHIPFINLHCVVLYGYDDDFFLFADPIRGNVAYKRSTFMNAYRQIGSRAVAVYENEG